MLINFMFATFYIATLFVIAKIDKKEHRIDKKMILLGFLLNYLRKGSFKVFAIYRIIIGLIIIGIVFIR